MDQTMSGRALGNTNNSRGPLHDEMSGLLHRRTVLLKNIEGTFGRSRELQENKLERIEEKIKGADPAYWKHLQEKSKQIGWRGETSVVTFLRKRGWFAKRSFGSWGVDVFTSKGNIAVDIVGLPGQLIPQKIQRAYLIDVKSSNIDYPTLEKVPRDPATLEESGRTGNPAIRAACLKSKPIRWFWYDGVEIDPKWFD